MARRLIRVGCCGWPVARARYFATFDLVEVQDTFYNLPRLATVERWRAQAPAGFEFVLKAPQLITHEPTSPTYRRLRSPVPGGSRARYGSFKPTPEVRAAWEATRALARALGARLVLFQCPASFGPSAEHIGNLAGFFERVERSGLGFVWEPRGAWTDDTIGELCRRLDLIHGVDPFERRSTWGEPAYFRLHGRGGYRVPYGDDDLRDLAMLARAAGAAYVLFNNMAMFDDGLRFLDLVGKPSAGPATTP
jgi:uncharacterized protein YecE (DUF72 family)